MPNIQLRDAKARLSAVVEMAARGETVTITRHGKPEAVMVGMEEWRRLSNVPSFGRFLASAPEGFDEFVARDPNPPRDVDL